MATLLLLGRGRRGTEAAALGRARPGCGAYRDLQSQRRQRPEELRHVCHRPALPAPAETAAWAGRPPLSPGGMGLRAGLRAGLRPGLGPGHTRAAAERTLRRSVDRAGPSVLLPLLVSLLSLSSLSLPLSPSLPRSFSRVCLCAGLVEPSVLPPSRLSLARSDSLSLACHCLEFVGADFFLNHLLVTA